MARFKLLANILLTQLKIISYYKTYSYNIVYNFISLLLYKFIYKLFNINL